MKIAIIGAGPAGLFAARRLLGHDVTVIELGTEPEKRHCPVTSKSRCTDCVPCRIMAGIGGAGAMSDGKLNLTHKIGGDPQDLQRSPEEVQKYIDEIDRVFLDNGMEDNMYGADEDTLSDLEKRASANGIEFLAGKQRHMGTDKTKVIIGNFYRDLKNRGVKFLINTSVSEIEKNGKFVLVTNNGRLEADYLIASPGRAGAYWFRSQAQKLGVRSEYGPIDVGVRLEFPATIYEEIERVMYDAKFRLYTKTYDDFVRTFCTNPNGFVTIEKYEDFLLVNGDARKNQKSLNTNLALLSRVNLTDPVEDTTHYGRSIARLANTIGGGRPILQRYKDLVRGKRSTWARIAKAMISPTLKDVTPGDIAMALPQRIVTNIIEAIERLDAVIEGISSDSTLLYAPEIKFYDTKYQVDKTLETTVENLFVAGDASGYSRGIVYAAVTGMIAAEGILSKMEQ